MFEDDDLDFDMDLSDPTVSVQEFSPRLSLHPAVPEPISSSNSNSINSNNSRKHHFPVSDLTDPEERGNRVGSQTFSHRVTASQSHRETGLKSSREVSRSLEETQPVKKAREQGSSPDQMFKVPPQPRPQDNLRRIPGAAGGGAGGSRALGVTGAQNLVRKFPGPAGLVNPVKPYRPGDKRRAPLDPAERDREKCEDSEEAVDADLEDLEDCFTWRKATEELRDFGKDLEVLKFNTNWIRDQAEAGEMGFKIPFFLGKIVQLDPSHKDPSVVLFDDHGKIDGRIHRDILENYGINIRPGTVLLVMKAAVMTTVRKTYINITLNNLVAIYSHQQQVLSHQQVSADEMRALAVEVERERREEEQETEDNSLTPTGRNISLQSPSPQAFSPLTPNLSRNLQSGNTNSPAISGVNRNLQSSNPSPFSPAMPTVNRNTQSANTFAVATPTVNNLSAFSPMMPPVNRNLPSNNAVPPVNRNGPSNTKVPPVNRNALSTNTLQPVNMNVQSSSSIRPGTPTVYSNLPTATPRLPSPLQLSPPSPLSPSPPAIPRQFIKPTAPSQQSLPTPTAPAAPAVPAVPAAPAAPAVPAAPAARPKFVFKSRSRSSVIPSQISQSEQAASQQLVSSLFSDLDTSDLDNSDIWADF